MRTEADSLQIFGYLGVLGLFIGLIIMCFFWGIWEYRKPKDPGPLFIDLDRTIKKKLSGPKFSTSKVPFREPPSHSRQPPIMAESIKLSQKLDANETIRVRGDVTITKGEVIPYNMIVEGNLVSQEDVTFQGGLHVKGRCVIGARNILEKSIVCQKELFLFEDVIVCNCIDCEGPVFIKNGVRVGIGTEGGGIASANTIYLENVAGPMRIYSEEGIRVAGDLEAVIPEDLRQVVEVKTS